MNATSVILKLVLKKWIDLGWSNERKISEEQMCFLQMIGTPALLDSLPFFYSFVLSIYWYYLSSSTIYLWLYYLFNVIIYLFVLSLHWYYLSIFWHYLLSLFIITYWQHLLINIIYQQYYLIFNIVLFICGEFQLFFA